MSQNPIVDLGAFFECGVNDPEHGIFHVGNGLFELRCSAGIVETEPGRTVHQLTDLLTFLASKGVRRSPLEWDGW